MSNRKVKIGLLWHSLNSSNLGIGALTVSQLDILSSAAKSANVDCEYHIMCWPAEGDFHQEIELPITLHYLRAKDYVSPNSKLRQCIKQCDVIFDIGAGDSWADLYGKKRFFYLFTSKLFALLYRKKLVLAPQTIGPFYNSYCRKLAVMIMRRCERVFARDEQSLNYLNTLEVNKNIDCVTDVAFRLPYEPQPSINSEKIKIGLNVSALLYSKERSGSDLIKLTVNYKTLIHDIIEYLLATPNVELMLVPHVISKEHAYENDMEVSKTIQKLYPELTLAPEFKGPSEAKNTISSLDLLIGSRMHATIAAISSNVPILPLSYSRKFTGLYSTLQYPYMGDLTADNEKKIMSELTKIMNALPEAKEYAIASNQLANDKLDRYEDYVAELLGQI